MELQTSLFVHMKMQVLHVYFQCQLLKYQKLEMLSKEFD